MIPLMALSRSLGLLSVRGVTAQSACPAVTLARGAKSLGFLQSPSRIAAEHYERFAAEDRLHLLRRDPFLSFFVGMVMRKSKRAEAEDDLRRLLGYVRDFVPDKSVPPRTHLMAAVDRAAPLITAIQFKFMKKSIFVPRALRERERAHMSIKWLLALAARKCGNEREARTRDPMRFIAEEVAAILRGEGQLLGQRKGQHKMALANRSTVSYKMKI